MSTVKSKKLQVGTDASASNNFTIYQPATPDGTLRIGVGNADSPTEVGQFNANGYKAANPVAFRVYKSTDQTGIGSNVATKVLYQTEVYDTHNAVSSSTFTAPISGYYMIDAGVHIQGPTGAYQLRIYVNGSPFQYPHVGYSNGTNASATGSCMLKLNASDTVEIYGRAAHPSTSTFYAGQEITWFKGLLIHAI
jgi:hypothetical protein